MIGSVLNFRARVFSAESLDSANVPRQFADWYKQKTDPQNDSLYYHRLLVRGDVEGHNAIAAKKQAPLNDLQLVDPLVGPPATACAPSMGVTFDSAPGTAAGM